ncbi:hypothetical protein BHK69_29980 (plasmid) [Bosea vaviloviae]|uniref:Uncharacterized protein n=1 Tax=Bosea vaviloviae TaxID=1526658 RepID=A0A1D7UC55_9HYPH|nr:hypothetical protein BHK69_29980 [Bosea vaviloviae]
MWLGPEHPFGKRSDDDVATVLLDVMASSESAYLLAPLLSHLDVRRLKITTTNRTREFPDNATVTESFEPDGAAL